MLGFIHYQLIISLLQSLIRSIKALPFWKKLVFRVGIKAVANRQTLLQFLVACRHVRIANVLGCVGWLKLLLPFVSIHLLLYQWMFSIVGLLHF
jgi:hypothetical protein